ncbi:sodium-independent sulfate anion transporter-like isoform X2 [Bradysia coprophila]|uniref:sodium-independent sulfate anion transporter-like isoform X2 n=1 Tax=Bradysia coprophila TaxID=38358 RepID=UPI00187DCA88|nr:sodium-independent sulfate anion transporter-like isoform X2 [Bradysia coprophila]
MMKYFRDVFCDPEDDHKEKLPDIKEIIKKNFRKKCTRETVINRFPIIKWLPRYQLNYLYNDTIAGISVALTAIPQGIAYAVVAGLDPQYGLYSEFMACSLYCIFGTCKELTIGPTAIMALMIQKFVADSQDFAVIIAFISGIVILILGSLNLGFLVQFISLPVTAGFTTAAALTIGSSQIKSLLGLPGQSSNFLEAIENFFKNADKAQLYDSLLGFSTIFMLLALRKLKDVKGHLAVPLKYVSLARNAIVVIFGTVLAYCLTQNGKSPFTLTGEVKAGLPDIKPPPFSTVVGNHTLGYGEILSHLGTGIISIPLIAIIEVIAVNKAFSRGQSVDGTQELIALGVCNLVGAFFQAMPVTGSFTRSAINHASGVKSTLGGVVTTILVVLSLVYLTQSFQFIPKATLAAVIITAMIFMVEFRAAVETWRVKRIDVLPFVVTLVTCLLLGLELGMVIGISVNIVFILYMTSRPKTRISHHDINGYEILLIEPNQSLVYTAAEHLKRKILKHSLNDEHKITTIVIDGHFVWSMDSTVAKTLKSCVDELNSNDKTILFWNWRSQPTGVAWRLGSDFGKLFKTTDTLDELIENEVLLKMSGSSVVSQ